MGVSRWPPPAFGHFQTLPVASYQMFLFCQKQRQAELQVKILGFFIRSAVAASLSVAMPELPLGALQAKSIFAWLYFHWPVCVFCKERLYLYSRFTYTQLLLRAELHSLSIETHFGRDHMIRRPNKYNTICIFRIKRASIIISTTLHLLFKWRCLPSGVGGGGVIFRIGRALYRFDGDKFEFTFKFDWQFAIFRLINLFESPNQISKFTPVLWPTG